MAEVISILAGILTLISIYLLGEKDIRGFIVSIICNILWILSIILGAGGYGLIIVCPVAIILNIKGYIQWRKN